MSFRIRLVLRSLGLALAAAAMLAPSLSASAEAVHVIQGRTPSAQELADAHRRSRRLRRRRRAGKSGQRQYRAEASGASRGHANSSRSAAAGPVRDIFQAG